MTTQACLDRIAAEPPPLNHQCPSICQETDFINNTHCSTLGVPVDTPILTKDPNGGGPNVPAYCYCCCSCFTANTLIEKRPGTFVMVQDIHAGDMILAAGQDLEWKPARVKERSGTATSEIAGLYIVFYRMAGESETRHVITTPGHLFLMASRRLQAVQHLQPGDHLAQADGGEAEVIFGMHNQDPFPTSIHTLLMEGDFDGRNLTGHLVNTNGVVSADYMVQVYFASEELSEPAGTAPAPLEIGSAEYTRRFHTPELHERLVALLPEGFKPAPHHPIVQIPATAERFLTDDEAGQVRENATFIPFNNPVPQIAAQRVILLARAGAPGALFLIDWRNDTPNVFSFIDAGQTFIVVTGGFVRITGIYADAVLFALMTMNARSSGFPCVTQADYQTLAYDLRKVLSDDTFVHIVTRALDQLGLLFRLIGPDGGQRLAKDRCKNPGVACREQTFDAALGFRALPACGKPPLAGFALTSARLSDAGATLQATFNDAVKATTALNITNYTLTPAGNVTGASVPSSNPNVVELTVTSVPHDAVTVLSVTGVVSNDDVTLLPDHDRVVITAAAAGGSQ